MACPICKKFTDATFHPFCSKRCADVDLGRWLSGSYSFPASDPEALEEAAIAVAQENLKLH